MILGALFGVLSALFGDFGGDGDSGFQISLSDEPFVFGVVVSFAYFFFFEGKTGATLGKRAMRIVVIKTDGSPCDLGAAAIQPCSALSMCCPSFTSSGS